MVTLGLLAAPRLQQIGLLLRFDAFGNDVDAEFPGEPQRSPDDGCASVISSDLVDEDLGDLDAIGGEQRAGS